MVRTHRSAVLGVLLLTAAALAVRLAGAGHLLPHLTEPDAHVVEQVAMHRSGAPERWRGSKAYEKYPHLLSRILAALPADELPRDPVGAAEVEERLVAVAAPYRHGRMLVALFASLAVPATWWLARRFVTEGAALLAAALLATSLLHASFSWQARPHGPLASLTTLALLACLALRRRPDRARYLLAGLLAALAIACLHSGVLVLPALLAAHFLAEPRPRGARAHARLVLLLPLLVTALAAFYPFLASSLRVESGGVEQAGHRFELAWLDGSGFRALVRDLAGHDPLLLGLTAAGALLVLVALARGERPDRARGGDLAVVLACALPYFVVLGLFQKTYERFQLPLLPFYACLAAFAVERAAGWLARRTGRGRGGLLAVLALAVLVLPTGLLVRLARLARAPDTGVLVARWLAEHVELGTERILVLSDTVLPVLQDPASLPAELDPDGSRRRPWTHHLREVGVEPGAPVWQLVTLPWGRIRAEGRLSRDDPRAQPLLRELLRELDCDWAVLERRPGNAPLFGTGDDGPLLGVPEAVAEAGELVTRISPFGAEHGRDTGLHPLLGRGHEDERLVLRALRARHFGPAYDVYKLR